jgi:hypothetical protein
MSRRTSLALVLVLAAVGGGCGTLDNVKRPTVAPPHKPDAPVCRVYGGVRSDWDIIWDYPLSRAPSPVDYVAIPVLAAGDLFFAFVGDTLTLPYTAYEEVRRAFFPPSAASEFEPVVVSESVPTAVTAAPVPPQATAPAPQPALGSHAGR